VTGRGRNDSLTIPLNLMFGGSMRPWESVPATPRKGGRAAGRGWGLGPDGGGSVAA
jgi:hypothetical protein